MEKEIVKLLNVLRRIARAAGYTAWTKSDPDAARFCVSQYNKVLARLTELEPALKPLFTTLAEDASPEITRIAAREVLAYFEGDTSEDAPEFARAYGRRFAFGCRPRRSRVVCVPISATCD
jgi:hypothetical protein